MVRLIITTQLFLASCATFALSLIESCLPCRETTVNAYRTGAFKLASSAILDFGLLYLDLTISIGPISTVIVVYCKREHDVRANIFPNNVWECVTASANVPINYQIINVYDISNKSVETEPTTSYQFIGLQPIDTVARAFVYDPYSPLPHSVARVNHVC